MARSTIVRTQNIPILENGDRLTRCEFERRYAQMPSHITAELIEGVVYVAAALRYRKHGRPHSLIIGWLMAYEAATSGVEVADNTTVRLDNNNEPQPDAILRINKENGGRSRISEDDYSNFQKHEVRFNENCYILID